jgi:glycosyltransferase involved in cell wall biosynthesis
VKWEARVGVFIPAYQASKTIEATLELIPVDVWEGVEEIFVQDNHSDDDTYGRVIAFRDSRSIDNLRVVRHSTNYGYGGSLKRAFTYALEQGFDVMVEFHADGQHPPERIRGLVEMVSEGDYDMAQASRVDRWAGGMPLYKLIGNSLLNRIEEFAFGYGLREYHSGFHAYRCASIARIPYMKCSNTYTITAEVFSMFKMFGLQVGEIEIPTYYGPEVSSCPPGASVRYGMQVMGLLGEYYLARFGVIRHPRFRLIPSVDLAGGRREDTSDS